MHRIYSTNSRIFTFKCLLLWSGIIFMVLALAGCKKDPRVEFIQGAWYYKNAHLANLPGESAQLTDWVFDNYYFTMNTCCFVEARYKGYYSIKDRAENELTLELFNMTGDMGGITLHKDDTLTIVIKIDPDTDTITISGDGPYMRVAK
jgi:hypothetical protein